MKAKTIVTMPPYAHFMEEVLEHPAVSGIRLNTVMPAKEPLDELVKRMNNIAEKHGKELWIDLKGRQLRVATYAVPPFTEIILTHEIEADAGAMAYFSDGNEHATVAAVDGRRLIMLEGPKRVVGPGESVNIPHASLKVKGYLTQTDRDYVEASSKNGLHNYMISFVEGTSDVEELKKLDCDARVIAKIESCKGLDYVANEWHSEARLMAARGDLFTEMKRPHQIIQALENIVTKDPDAIAASRLFKSLSESYEPTSADISDADNLLRMGYRTFMLGDDVCMERNSVMSAINLFEAIAERY